MRRPTPYGKAAPDRRMTARGGAHPTGPARDAGLPPVARRAIALTRAVLWWQALARAFWPAASLLVAGGAALAFGIGAVPWIGPVWGPVLVGGVLALGFMGLRRLVPPASGAALARVDAALPGQPLAALQDRLAIGQGNAGAAALWSAHQARARAAAKWARPCLTRPNLAARDPFALRLAAIVMLVMALIFGDIAGLGQGWGALASGSRPAPTARPAPDGVTWEGWAEPPAHTGRPVVYLNALPEGEGLILPQGSRVNLRLYGEGDRYSQTIGPTEPDTTPDAPAFTALQDGMIHLPAGRQFAVTIIPDLVPHIQAGPAASRRADGRFVQGFTAGDDYGVTMGKAAITLDLDAVPRRYGLATEPEPRPDLTLDLPLPARGREEFRGSLSADLARHPFANLPVTLTFEVEDGLAQTATSAPLRTTLPGRRFFEPRAAALVELRQALLWSRENRAEVAATLRALLWPPGDLFPPDLAEGLKAAVARLEADTLAPRQRDDLAEALWQAAVLLEDGGLSDALARMQRAQERLSEAIRQGASPDEIARLMRELREATDAYTRMLADRGEAPEDRFTRKQPGQNITANQLQQMMDEIERLMREGRMAEAQILLDQFNRLMENLSVQQGAGEGGEPGGAGQGALEGLTDTMRDQQGLSDQSMRRGRDGRGLWQPLDPGDADDLADEQRELREQLGRQRALIPGQGSAAGDEAGAELDEAGRAMREAEDALRRGDVTTALEGQAEAIRRLREGMRRLAEGERADEAGRAGPDGTDAGDSGEGAADGRQGRDPLGRSLEGAGGGITTDGPLAEGEATDPTRRARDLLDEIRRRSGEMIRPEAERDYLRRLLDRF